MVLKKVGEPMKYTLPGGIKKRKETEKEALIREIEEEIELQLTEDQVQFYLSCIKRMKGATVNKNYYYANLKRLKIKVLESYKFETVVWLNWKKAIAFMYRSDRMAVKTYFKNIRRKNKKIKIMNAKFHLALPCKNIEETREFYEDIIKVKLGRSTENWLDVDLYGNQLTFTRAGHFNFEFKSYKLDDFVLPSFHFGVIVPIDIWGGLYGRLFKMALEVTTEATFMQGKKGEHLSFFVQDPNSYMLEFKSFKNAEEVFSV